MRGVWIGIVVAAAGAWVVAARRAAVGIEEEVRGMRAGPGRGRADLDVASAPVPDPVRRFVTRALGPTVRPATRLELTQVGTFRLTPTSAGFPTRAHQLFRVDRPAYLWRARMRVAPGLGLAIRDRYDRGQGEMLGRLAGVIPFLRDGRDEVGEGALVRWAAEAGLFPEVLLDPAIFSWTAIDERTAEARVTDAGRTVRLRWHFGDDDLVTRVTCPDRPRREGDVVVRGPWSGDYGGWRPVAGRWVPSRMSATWHLATGDFTYVELELGELAVDADMPFGG